MKLILSNCMMNNGNRGCVALSLSTMYILKDLIESKGQQVEFYLSKSGHNEYGTHHFKSGKLEFSYTAIPDISCHNKMNILDTCVKLNRTLSTRKIYKKADAILDIGQGDSFSDIYGEGRFRSIYNHYKLGMLFNKPFCILPQTIGPYENPNIRKKAVKAIKYAKNIMVRDKQSLDYLHSIAPNINAKETIDVAFFMPYQPETFDNGMINVGINISSLLWHGGYTQNNQFGLSVDYKALIHNIITHFLSLNNVAVHLIPHVVGGQRGLENDYAVSYDIWKEFSSPKLILPPLFLDPIIAKNYIAGLDFFMGARMHATIAAFSSGVPVVPMAYSRKFNGLFCDTLSYNALVDMKKCNNQEALNIIKQSFSDREQLKKHITSQMNTTVKERGNIIKNELANFLGL